MRGAKTARERAYLAAVSNLHRDFEETPQQARLLDYRNAMEDVAAKYPEDHEAKIFYALALAVAADPGDKTYADQLKAGAILQKLFDEEPTHPGLAHYIIHAYDVPALAGRSLIAARRYSEIAPDAPHALHMPSHTFTRLGDWQASIGSNVAAAAAARQQGQTAEELHASDYETYAYLQVRSIFANCWRFVLTPTSPQDTSSRKRRCVGEAEKHSRSHQMSTKQIRRRGLLPRMGLAALGATGADIEELRSFPRAQFRRYRAT
jgi:hypothetical protein